jgi:hypothetical protein
VDIDRSFAQGIESFLARWAGQTTLNLSFGVGELGGRIDDFDWLEGTYGLGLNIINWN